MARVSPRFPISRGKNIGWRDAENTTYGRVQIHENGSRDVFAISSLGEKRLEGSLGQIHLLRVTSSIRQQTVLEQVPAPDPSFSKSGPLQKIFHTMAGQRSEDVQ